MPHKRELDIEVLESPKLAPPTIQVTQPAAPPKKPVQHEVFGVSRKAITSAQGETVKAGNTIAKAPDQETLKPGDQDSLPIPQEEYLITQMPELRTEVRIPYPPESKKKGIQGAVVMDILIDSMGKVREVVFVDGPDTDLNNAAVAATKNFQFSPALITTKPVAVRIRYAYRFVLEH
jgi:periplasmic protein TonB